MAHELGGAIGQLANQLRQLSHAEAAGQLEACEVIGSAAIAICEHALKAVAEKIQTFRSGHLQPRRASASGCYGEFKKPPEPGEAEIRRGSCQQLHHLR